MLRSGTAMLVTLALAGFAAAPASGQASPAAGAFAGLVDAGGRKLYLECSGAGRPAVLLVSGYRNNADIWTVEGRPGERMVMPAVAGFARVCAWDRPGTILDATHLGRSDPVAMPRTAEDIVDELHALLRAAALPAPYVLAAHSLGGLFARLYASTYPDAVAGLVLVDAWPEAMPQLLGPDQWAAYETLAGPAPPGLEGYRDLETVDFGAASDTMRAAAARAPLRDIPLIVLSRGKPVALPPGVPASFSPDAFERAWREGQAGLAGLRPDARHETAAESDHYIQVEQPDLVIDAVRQVVEAARDPASWR